MPSLQTYPSSYHHSGTNRGGTTTTHRYPSHRMAASNSNTPYNNNATNNNSRTVDPVSQWRREHSFSLNLKDMSHGNMMEDDNVSEVGSFSSLRVEADKPARLRRRQRYQYHQPSSPTSSSSSTQPPHWQLAATAQIVARDPSQNKQQTSGKKKKTRSPSLLEETGQRQPGTWRNYLKQCGHPWSSTTDNTTPSALFPQVLPKSSTFATTRTNGLLASCVAPSTVPTSTSSPNSVFSLWTCCGGDDSAGGGQGTSTPLRNNPAQSLRVPGRQATTLLQRCTQPRDECRQDEEDSNGNHASSSSGRRSSSSPRQIHDEGQNDDLEMDDKSLIVLELIRLHKALHLRRKQEQNSSRGGMSPSSPSSSPRRRQQPPPRRHLPHQLSGSNGDQPEQPQSQRRRVHFAPQLVTETHTRPYTELEEIPNLYFIEEEMNILEVDRQTVDKDQFEVFVDPLAERVQISHQTRNLCPAQGTLPQSLSDLSFL